MMVKILRFQPRHCVFYASQSAPAPIGILLTFYLIIYQLIIAPLQGNYSEALPAQARTKRRVLRSLYKELERSRGRERSSEERPFKTEGPTIEKALFCLVAVRARGTRESPLEAELSARPPRRSATRAGRSQDKELQKLRRSVTKNPMPDNR